MTETKFKFPYNQVKINANVLKEFRCPDICDEV